MAVRRILVDPALPVDLSPLEAHEVLVVSADPVVLAEAGRLGLHRLVPGDDDAATEAAVAELVELLDR